MFSLKGCGSHLAGKRRTISKATSRKENQTKTCLQQIEGPVERSVNGQSLKMVLPQTNHAYMYLQHQDDMSCWRHSLCTILGWNIHPEFSSSDWLMACMVTFAEVPEEYKKLLDKDMETITDDKGVVIYTRDLVLITLFIYTINLVKIKLIIFLR